MKINKTKFHFPLPILVGEGKLILDASNVHSEVAGRQDKTYLADTAIVLGNVKTQATDQKQKRSQTSVLSKTQLDLIHTFQHLIQNAKETAKLAFPGQAVKLREAFQVGVHKPHDLQSQLQRGRIVLASLQAPENVAAVTARGWTADETTALDTVITNLENDKTLLENAKDASIGSTSQKNVQADDLYDRLLTVQNAASLQWPESDPSSAQIRADFRIGKFPPKDHGGHQVEPTPTPPPQGK